MIVPAKSVMSRSMSRSVTPFLRLISVSFLTLALLGVFIRALIPVGFMPDFGQQAGTALVICSGLETKTIYVDDKGQPAPAHKVETPCEFALNPVALKPAVSVSSLFVPYIADFVAPDQPLTFAVAWVVTHAEARGPPSLSI